MLRNDCASAADLRARVSSNRLANSCDAPQRHRVQAQRRQGFVVQRHGAAVSAQEALCPEALQVGDEQLVGRLLGRHSSHTRTLRGNGVPREQMGQRERREGAE